MNYDEALKAIDEIENEFDKEDGCSSYIDYIEKRAAIVRSALVEAARFRKAVEDLPSFEDAVKIVKGKKREIIRSYNVGWDSIDAAIGRQMAEAVFDVVLAGLLERGKRK